MESWEQDSLKDIAPHKQPVNHMFNGILGAGFVERVRSRA